MHIFSVNSTVKQPRNDEKVLNENKELPQLSQSSRGRTPRQFVIDTDDNGVEKGRRNKKQILPQLASPNTLAKAQKEKDICEYGFFFADLCK
ncbi:hypothetical protein NECAME_03236 [Necator americanus]|uniref:Uncharacterized protein n=1 Tax=Necator americanus TaxID=51031 RepID=W2T5Q0_NECAM|nr:hypothetical protein NECAME_03236 [Necator americanus]ETN77335.1 hypothetical protein NECAME_03236 [Necator americanus]